MLDELYLGRLYRPVYPAIANCSLTGSLKAERLDTKADGNVPWEVYLRFIQAGGVLLFLASISAFVAIKVG